MLGTDSTKHYWGETEEFFLSSDKKNIFPNKYNTNQPKLDVKYNASNPWKVISQTFTGDASMRQNDCVGRKF